MNHFTATTLSNSIISADKSSQALVLRNKSMCLAAFNNGLLSSLQLAAFNDWIILGTIFHWQFTLLSGGIDWLLHCLYPLVCSPYLKKIFDFSVWVIRGTPLPVQPFLIFYDLSSIGFLLEAFPAAWIGFILNIPPILQRSVKHNIPCPTKAMGKGLLYWHG